MAMTGGTAVKVKSYKPSGWSGPIELYVYYKIVSQNPTTNKTDLSLGMYVTTPSGWWIGAWGDKSGSYLEAEGVRIDFDGSIPSNTQGERWIAENKQVTINHNEDGGKIATIMWQWGVKSISTYGFSGSNVGAFNVTLPNIPRISTLSVSNGVLGEQQFLTVSKAVETNTHTITYRCGEITGTVCTKASEDSIAWIPPIVLANSNTIGQNVQVFFEIQTYNGETQIGSPHGKSVTMAIPDSVKMEVLDVAAYDETGYQNIYGGYIQGQSVANVQVTYRAVAGETLQTCKIEVDGGIYNGTSCATNKLANTGEVPITVTLVDSRNRATTEIRTIHVLPYNPPQITKLQMRRCNQDGTANDEGVYAKATLGYTVTPLGGINTVTAELLYKKVADQNYDSITIQGGYTEENIDIVFEADDNSPYDIRLVVEDGFSETVTTTTVSTAFTLMDFHSSGRGIAFGKVAEDENLVDIAMPILPRGGIIGISDLVYPVGSVYMSVNALNPSVLFGGTWEQKQDRFLIGAGGDYEPGDTGGSAELQAHTHTLSGGTVSSNGAHTHTIKGLAGNKAGTGGCIESFSSGAQTTRDITNACVSAGSHSHTLSGDTGTAGTGNSGNLPPYFAVYIWIRTA